MYYYHHWASLYTLIYVALVFTRCVLMALFVRHRITWDRWWISNKSTPTLSCLIIFEWRKNTSFHLAVSKMKVYVIVCILICIHQFPF